jgi:hypothetical protein
MRLLWNEPPPNTPDADFPKLYWERAVKGWLSYMGVSPHDDQQHWRCEYNYCYHFFDITIYECWLPGNGKPDHVIQDMRSYLQSTNLQWSEHSTYTWDNHKQRPGVRFWIQAEDHLK